MTMSIKKMAVAYVPVLHNGYLTFFHASEAPTLFLVGRELLIAMGEPFDYLVRKDALRALPAEAMQKAVETLGMFEVVKVLTPDTIARVGAGEGTIVMPEEDISHTLHTHYFTDAHVSFVPMFLRWHRDNTQEEKQVAAHRSVSVSAFDREVMARLEETARTSHDWWRQVAAAIVQDREIVAITNNKHMPDPQSPNANGDPRAVYRRGVAVNLSTSAHAEVSLIAAAAREGKSLAGASLYVTDFPCPFCARAIVQSGITKVYFKKGYAMLDGETLLKDAGIEIVAVTDAPAD